MTLKETQRKLNVGSRMHYIIAQFPEVSVFRGDGGVCWPSDCCYRMCAACRSKGNWKRYFASNCANEFGGNSVPDFCRCTMQDAHGLGLCIAKQNGLTTKVLFGTQTFISDLGLCPLWMTRVSSGGSYDPFFLSSCVHSVRGGFSLCSTLGCSALQTHLPDGNFQLKARWGGLKLTRKVTKLFLSFYLFKEESVMGGKGKNWVTLGERQLGNHWTGGNCCSTDFAGTDVLCSWWRLTYKTLGKLTDVSFHPETENKTWSTMRILRSAG